MPNERPSADGVVSGKRLIHLNDARKLSFGEQIARAWHRISWRGPLQSLRAGSGGPLQLIAVPDDLILGDLTRGQALLSGHLRWMQQDMAFDDLSRSDSPIQPALAQYLHGFSWLRDLSSVASRKDAAPVAENLARIWLDHFANSSKPVLSRPDIIGSRILFVTAHAPLLFAETDMRDRMLKQLARWTRGLSKTIGQADDGLARISAWAGIVASGLLLSNGRTRLSGGEAGLVKALRQGVTADGGLVSRSPVEQFDLLSILVMVHAAYGAAPSREAPPFLDKAIALAASALNSATHGDGGLSGFQGSPPLENHRIETALTASSAFDRANHPTRDWGYQKVVAGPLHLIMDAGPPPANHHAHCACASAFAIEISDDSERLIVGCGGASALTGDQEERLKAGLRSTAAHSVLSIADANSNVLVRNGSLGSGVTEIDFAKEEVGDLVRLSASHDGYAQRFGFETKRIISLDKRGRVARGEEILVPMGRGGKAQPVTVRFHAGPGVAVMVAKGTNSAEFQLPSGKTWRFTCSDGVMTAEPSLWIDASGKPLQTAQLCITAEAPAGGFILSWALERLSSN